MNSKTIPVATILAPAVVALFLSGISVPDTEAKSFYLDDFNIAYGTSATRLDTCGVCHYDFNGGQAKNPYGEAFLASGYNFAIIAGEDSDGDGATNVSEITVYLTLPGATCDDLSLLDGAPADVGDYVEPGTVCRPTSCADHRDQRACRDDARCEWIGSPRAGFCREVLCAPTEDPEISCHDGTDNDCDGATDTDDPDCFGRGLAMARPVATSQ